MPAFSPFHNYFHFCLLLSLDRPSIQGATLGPACRRESASSRSGAADTARLHHHEIVCLVTRNRIRTIVAESLRVPLPIFSHDRGADQPRRRGVASRQAERELPPLG